MALLLLVAMTACVGNGEMVIKLGTSDYSLILPEGYEKADDDFAEDQIAYYYKDDDSIDFDVYQWTKDGQITLESKVDFYGDAYDTTPEAVTINGINAFKFISAEEYEGVVYSVVNYMFEDEESITGVCFWTDGTDEEYAEADAIINTLKKN